MPVPRIDRLLPLICGWIKIQLNSWGRRRGGAAWGHPGRESTQDGAGLPGPTRGPSMCTDAGPRTSDAPMARALVAAASEMAALERKADEAWKGIHLSTTFPILQSRRVRSRFKMPRSFLASSDCCPTRSHWPPSSPDLLTAGTGALGGPCHGSLREVTAKQSKGQCSGVSKMSKPVPRTVLRPSCRSDVFSR